MLTGKNRQQLISMCKLSTCSQLRQITVIKINFIIVASVSQICVLIKRKTKATCELLSRVDNATSLAVACCKKFFHQITDSRFSLLLFNCSSFFATNMNHYGQAAPGGHHPASLSPTSAESKSYHGLEINRVH
jgi:hypothetical protein